MSRRGIFGMGQRGEGLGAPVICLSARREETARELLEAMYDGEAGHQSVDWCPDDISSERLVRRDNRSQLQSERRIEASWIQNLLGQLAPLTLRTTGVEVRQAADMPGGGQCSTLVLVLSCRHGDDQTTVLDTEFLANARAFLEGTAHAPQRLIFVFGDATFLLTPKMPPLDPLDYWQRLSIGEPIGDAPMREARDIRNWNQPLREIDLNWGGRLGGLAAIAKRRGCEVMTLPVSIHGFDPRTGRALTGEDGEPVGVPFNLRSLVQSLAPDAAYRPPNLFELFEPSGRSTSAPSAMLGV